MAIHVPGKSRCPLCSRLIAESEVVPLPPFCVNPRDELFAFSDGVFHRPCLAADVGGRRALVPSGVELREADNSSFSGPSPSAADMLRDSETVRPDRLRQRWNSFQQPLSSLGLSLLRSARLPPNWRERGSR